VPPHALDTLRSRGVLTSLGRGVDRLRDHPFDYWAQCQAALDLAGPGAVLGLRSAARLHGFYAYRRSGEVEVIVRRGRDARTSIGRIVQTRSLPPQHVTAIQGFPVTTVARTFFDMCGDPDPGLRRRGGHPVHEKKMARVYNDAVGRRGLTLVQELAVLAALAQRGRRGTRLVRQLLLRFGPRYVPTRSATETLFFELVASFGLPEPEKQAVITDIEGWIGTVGGPPLPIPGPDRRAQPGPPRTGCSYAAIDRIATTRMHGQGYAPGPLSMPRRQRRGVAKTARG
jgi:hypothetical protein